MGRFHVFGHGGCFGEIGHCDVQPRRLFDSRKPHALTPITKTVEVIRRVACDAFWLPTRVLRADDPQGGRFLNRIRPLGWAAILLAGLGILAGAVLIQFESIKSAEGQIRLSMEQERADRADKRRDEILEELASLRESVAKVVQRDCKHCPKLGETQVMNFPRYKVYFSQHSALETPLLKFRRTLHFANDICRSALHPRVTSICSVEGATQSLST